MTYYSPARKAEMLITAGVAIGMAIGVLITHPHIVTGSFAIAKKFDDHVTHARQVYERDQCVETALNSQTGECP